MCSLTFTVGVIICVTLLFICTVFLTHYCFYQSLVNKDFQWPRREMVDTELRQGICMLHAMLAPCNNNIRWCRSVGYFPVWILTYPGHFPATMYKQCGRDSGRLHFLTWLKSSRLDSSQVKKWSRPVCRNTNMVYSDVCWYKWLQ